MRIFRFLFFTMLVLGLSNCDLLLGPIGPLSQVHKSLQNPWTANINMFSTINSGTVDQAKVEFASRGGSLMLVFGVQASATTQEDIVYYTSLDLPTPQSHIVIQASGSGMLNNVFDITRDSVPSILYKQYFGSEYLIYNTGTTITIPFTNNQFAGYNLMLPDATGWPIGEYMATLQSVDPTGANATNFVSSLPAMDSYLRAVKSFYINTKNFVSYISRDSINGTNFLSTFEFSLNNNVVQNFPIKSMVWTYFSHHQYDVTFSETETLYAAVDSGIFVGNGGGGLNPVSSTLPPIQMTNGVALFVKNDLIHVVNTEGAYLDYRMIDESTGNIIIQEELTNLFLSGVVKGLDIYVDNENVVYIGVLEYKAGDKTYGHLLRR